MSFRVRILRSILVGGLLFGLAAGFDVESGRSASREPILKGNPRRDAGGSCVYDKKGNVVFAPAGKRCPNANEHLSHSHDTEAPVLNDYPPAVRGELSKLLGDHNHIDEELARLSLAVQRRNRDIALEMVKNIRSKLAAHRARENSFFEKMAPNRRSR